MQILINLGANNVNVNVNVLGLTASVLAGRAPQLPVGLPGPEERL